jgi:hypothetical protein
VLYQVLSQPFAHSTVPIIVPEREREIEGERERKKKELCLTLRSLAPRLCLLCSDPVPLCFAVFGHRTSVVSSRGLHTSPEVSKAAQEASEDLKNLLSGKDTDAQAQWVGAAKGQV